MPDSVRRRFADYSFHLHLFALLFFLSGLLATGNVLALGLGKITVSSRLGANLFAEVELLAAAGEDRYAAECFRLAQPVDPDAGLPALTKGSLTLERKGERLYLIVRSSQPVNEPILLLSLRAGCGAEIIREYTLLIDGPEMVVAAPTLPRQPAVNGDTELAAGQRRSVPDTSDNRRTSRANRAVRAEAPAARAQTPASRQQTMQAAPAAKNPPTLPPTTSQAASRDGMSDRLSLSGASPDDEQEVDEWSLRLSTELSSEKISIVTERQRAILRLEYKLLAAIHDQASQQLSLAEQVRLLESSVLALKAITEESAGVPIDGASVSSSPNVTPKRPTNSPVSEPHGLSSNWLWLVGLLVVVALLVWLLRRSSHRLAQESLSAPVDTGLSDETLLMNEPEPEPDLAVLRSESSSPPAPAAAGDVSAQTVREASPIHPPTTIGAPHGETVIVEHDAFDPVMELAEIMLAFGRVKGAVEALQEYIDHHPDGAIQPWMKLIEIYAQNGMRAEYETLVPQFQAHFNVSPADWTALPEVAPQPVLSSGEENSAVADLLIRTPNLSSLSAVRDMIVLQWGAGARDTRVCLNALLRDRNNATYQGCSLSMVNELLFLLTVLDKRLGNVS